MLIENVQNLINALEGQQFNLNGFDCKVEKGTLIWNSESMEEGVIDIAALSQEDLSELYNELLDLQSELDDSEV
ncbi:MAG: hypothetical protein ACM3X7_13525 [Solirubrobacterales bacterium]